MIESTEVPQSRTPQTEGGKIPAKSGFCHTSGWGRFGCDGDVDSAMRFDSKLMRHTGAWWGNKNLSSIAKFRFVFREDMIWTSRISQLPPIIVLEVKYQTLRGTEEVVREFAEEAIPNI